MFIHIGAGRAVRDRDIIGCFDMDGKWDSDTTKAFLKNAERSGKTESAGDDLPRTFIVTDSGVIFSHISSVAICARGEKAIDMK